MVTGGEGLGVCVKRALLSSFSCFDSGTMSLCKKIPDTCLMCLIYASSQLLSLSRLCIVVPYLHFVLDASYSDIAVVLGCMFVGVFVGFQCIECLACCKSPSKCLFVVQVLTSAIVITCSSIVFSTIHFWPGLDGDGLKALRIGLAALFNGLAGFASVFHTSQSPQLLSKSEGQVSLAYSIGSFIGAAIWTGLLWLPIDFPTQAYCLFGLVSMIVILSTLLILMDSCWKSCQTDKNESSTSDPSSSSVKVQEMSCCERIRNFGCSMWLSWMSILLFGISITPILYFLTDWLMSCDDSSCLLNSNLGLYDVNYPTRIYSYVSIGYAVGHLVSWVYEALCKSYVDIIIRSIAVLAMIAFDIALFAIGYTENQTLWTILLFVSAGHCFLFRNSIHVIALFIYGHENMELSLSDKSNQQLFYRLLMFLDHFGPTTGLILICLILENSDYVTLFKVSSILILLMVILMVALFIRVRTLESINADNKEIVDALQKAKPRMIFKKLIKSA